MDSISSKNGGHDEEKDLFISRIGSDSLHVCRLCPGRRQGRFFFCGAGIRRKKTVELTDQNGRTVTVEYPVERIACMQHHSLDILTQLGAQEQIVCTEDKWMTDLGSYMKDVFPGIEELPTAGTPERSERRGDRGAGSRSRHFSGSVQ